MSPEEQQELKEYAKAIAKILYKNTETKELNSLGKIEEAVRSGMQQYVMPEVGVFLSKISQEKARDMKEN
jgi:hydrogenase maturation factor